MDEEFNKGNLNDYNNQGIDVTTSNRKDSNDCIFNNIKEKFQNATLRGATKIAGEIGADTQEIIDASNKAKLNIKKEERTPKYINADPIKRDMNEAERTMDDFTTEANNFSEKFNQENNWNLGQQINAQFNQQKDNEFEQQGNAQFNQQKENEFEQQGNNQFGQQKDNKIGLQSNNQFNRNNDWER